MIHPTSSSSPRAAAGKDKPLSVEQQYESEITVGKERFSAGASFYVDGTPPVSGQLPSGSVTLAKSTAEPVTVGRIRFFEPGHARAALTVNKVPTGQKHAAPSSYSIPFGELKLDTMKQYIAVVDFRIGDSTKVHSVRTEPFLVDQSV